MAMAPKLSDYTRYCGKGIIKATIDCGRKCYLRQNLEKLRRERRYSPVTFQYTLAHIQAELAKFI